MSYKSTKAVKDAANWYRAQIDCLGAKPSDMAMVGLHGQADGRFGCSLACKGWRLYLEQQKAK